MLGGPGQYSDILRVIGRLLDEREALLKAEALDPVAQALAPEKQPAVGYEDVEIVEHESFVRVSWRTRTGSGARQAYTDLNLARLRARSRQLRGETCADPSGEREELFRTLGQELDAQEVHVSGIFEKDDQFIVSGSADGRYVSRAFGRDDLLLLSQHRRQLRPISSLDEWEEADAEEPVTASQRARWLVWGYGVKR
jgi:hypothetical protein